jgi:ABC-type bacteriocin/lantibiotic exporter with double-glycine peptidase domain
MVLAYWGDFQPQEQLAKQLELRPYLGTPVRNIHRLASIRLRTVVDQGDLLTLQKWLDHDVPVIAFIQAGELPHWRGEYFQHAVVIVAMNGQSVWMLDPDMGEEPVVVGIDDFMLAWGGLDYLYALLIKSI